MPKRFFAFGCSFTEFTWPTWADIIAKTLSTDGWECYNYGNSGSGNYGILASMFAADKKHKFTDDDIIMVMWSSWNREDRYIVNYKWDPALRAQWTKEGNILTASSIVNGVYDEKFVEKYWSLENDIITNTLAIESARKMFKITHEGSLPCYEDPNNVYEEIPDEDDSDDIASLIFKKFARSLENYDNNWATILRPALTNTMDNEIKESDGHPLPSEHMLYVTNVIQQDLPDIPLVNASTLKWVRRWGTLMRKKFTDHKNSNHIHNNWQLDLQVELRRQQSEFLSGTRFTLWNDETIMMLLDQIKSENYKT